MNPRQFVLDELNENCTFEEQSWAVDRVDRILERFASAGTLSRSYDVVIPWLNSVNAFTVKGGLVVFSRKLFQECATDEMAAFVIAHEIGHHELGHFDGDSEEDEESYIDLANRHLTLFFNQPEMECDADEFAINLCIKAGYDPFSCLDFFRKLEKIYLDYGDIKSAMGMKPDCDDELSPDASRLTKARVWWFYRLRGYLPVRDRKQRLVDFVEDAHGLLEPPQPGWVGRLLFLRKKKQKKKKVPKT